MIGTAIVVKHHVLQIQEFYDEKAGMCTNRVWSLHI